MARLLAVPGLETTTPAFRRLLWEIAERNHWNADHLATVISVESAFRPDAKNPLPGQTASGLIQMLDSTARGLGIAGGAAAVRAMTAEEQLPWVEKYFQRAFRNLPSPRRVDYYCALYGRGIGAEPSTVLARRDDAKTYNQGSDNEYSLNRGLDWNSDGALTVGDLDAVLQARQNAAKGRFLEVDETAPLEGVTRAALQAVGWVPGSDLPRPASSYLRRLSRSLPTLRANMRGDLVAVLQFKIGASPDECFGPITQAKLAEFQRAHGLEPTGVADSETWAKLFEPSHSDDDDREPAGNVG